MSKRRMLVTMVGLLILALTLSGCGMFKKAGNVSGTVKYADGTPISGAVVIIGDKTATSGSTGAYSVDDINYGDHTMEVKVDDELVFTQEVSVQGKSTLVDVVVAKVGAITGTASRATGLGLAGADILLYEGTTQVAFTATDESGAFSFADVPFGSYGLKVLVGAAEMHSGNVTVSKVGTTAVPAISVSIVDGVIWEEGFEYVVPGEKPLGHSSFAGPGGVLNTTLVYAGNNSWELESFPDTNSGMRTISVPAVPGKTYTARANYSMTGYNGASLYLEFQDADQKRISAGSAAGKKITEGTWEVVEKTDVAPEGTVYVATILYYPKYSIARTTYFDNVKLIESDTPVTP